MVLLFILSLFIFFGAMCVFALNEKASVARPAGEARPDARKPEKTEQPTPSAPTRPRIVSIDQKPEKPTVAAAGEAGAAPRCALANPAKNLVTVVSGGVPALRDADGVAPRAFDPRDDLTILETRPGWLRLRRTPPRWPPGQKAWEGWALESVVRPVHRSAETMTADEKACLFTDPTSWSGVGGLQGVIRDVALKILRQDERCRLIGDGGMMGEGQRFFLTCYPSDGGSPYHYWLSAASADKDFAPPAPVDEDAAMSQCRSRLDKLLQGRSAMQGRRADAVSTAAISSYRERAAYYMTIYYRLGEGPEEKAYCFVPPGRDAEITLPEPG